MNLKNLLFISMSAFFIQSCSDDDIVNEPENPVTEEPTTEETEETENSAPDAFDLLTIENESTNTSRTPTLTWEASADIDNDDVTYDVYLDTEMVPQTKIAENLTETTFTVVDALDRESTYYWNVVAKDENNAETSSNSIFSLTTSGIVFSASAVESNTSFTARDKHTVVEFNGKLWLIGGSDENYNLGDVWSSEDGENWTLVAETPFGLPKKGHTSLVFDNKLWAISGFFNDVWSSTNGIDWVRTTSDLGFDTREGHASFVFNNKMWIVGGRDNQYQSYNDVWSSSDGIEWTQETANAQFSPRANHTITVLNGVIYLIGGGGVSSDFVPGYSNEVYSSVDGINWTKVETSSIFEPREAHTAIAFDNKIWVTGGWQVTSNDMTGEQQITSFNDVWFSADGATWQQLETNENYEGRLDHASVSFEDKLYIMGGFKIGPSPNDRDYFNDIWVIE